MAVTIVGNLITATGTVNTKQYTLSGSVAVSGDDARLDYAPDGPFFVSFESPAFTGCNAPAVFEIVPTSIDAANDLVRDSANNQWLVVSYRTGGDSPTTVGKQLALSGGYCRVSVFAKPEEFSGWHYVEGTFTRTVGGAGFQRYDASLLLTKPALQRVLDENIYPLSPSFSGVNADGPWAGYPCGLVVQAEDEWGTSWSVRLVFDPAFNRCHWVIERSYSDEFDDFFDVITALVEPTGPTGVSVRVNSNGTLTLVVGGDSQNYTPPDNASNDEPKPDRLRVFTQVLSAVTPSEESIDPPASAINVRNVVGTN